VVDNIDAFSSSSFSDIGNKHNFQDQNNNKNNDFKERMEFIFSLSERYFLSLISR
jgi:hypothetical protein